MALAFGKIRVPDLEDEDVAGLVAAVPGFVLDRVVKNENLAVFPLATRWGQWFELFCSRFKAHDVLPLLSRRYSAFVRLAR